MIILPSIVTNLQLTLFASGRTNGAENTQGKKPYDVTREDAN